MFAVDRLWVEADVVDLCPPRPARIKDYNGRSRRAGYRRDAHRTRTGESLHRCAVSTAILVSWLLSPTHCRASGAERADRIRSRGGSTQPRQYRRTRYFGRNELSRLCLAVLRTAAGTRGASSPFLCGKDGVLFLRRSKIGEAAGKLGFLFVADLVHRDAGIAAGLAFGAVRPFRLGSRAAQA